MFIKNMCYTKLCAVVTAVCFTISVYGSNLYAISNNNQENTKYEEIFNKTDIVNDKYGSITSITNSNSDVTVINICDLHCNPNVQKNISSIINQLNKQYNNIDTIFVEGGYGNIDVHWIDKVENKDKVIDMLINKGLLTGSEYFKLTFDTDIKLKGLDDEKLHKDNIKRLAWLINNQEKYTNVLNRIDVELNLLEATYLNSKNKKFNELINKYYTGKLDNKKFYRYLLKYANSINKNPKKYNNITKIKLENYPNILNLTTITNIGNNINTNKLKQELSLILLELKNKIPYSVYSKFIKSTDNFKDIYKTTELLSKLSEQENINLKDRYTQLYKFIEYNKYKSKINLVNLVYEERNLIDQIRKSLSYNNEEYEISYLIDFYKYFQDYLKYKLTQEDWQYFKTGITKFEYLYNKYASVNRILSIKKDFKEINKYYDINEERNNIFVQNILAQLKPNIVINSDSNNTNEILNNSKKIVIAVTGGFHTTALQNILTNNNINVLVITPNIYDNNLSALRYNQVIKYQSILNSQALAYTILSCLENVEKPNLISNIVTDLLGDNSIKILKQITHDDYIYLYDNNLNKESISEKEAIKDIITTTVDKILDVMPNNWQDLATISNINDILLNMVTKLVEHGIIFSNGKIFNIERFISSDEDLNGIPAEIYSRILPSLQKVLLDNKQLESNISISNEQLNILYKDTGATGYIEIYLTDPKALINKKIREAAIENKLIIFHFSRYREQEKILNKLKLYYDLENFRKTISKVDLLKVFPELQGKEQFIQEQLNGQFHYGINFFFSEILKNAFVHGNKGMFEYPIIFHAKLDSNNNFKQFSIYDYCVEHNMKDTAPFIREVHLSGAHLGIPLMKTNLLYNYNSKQIYDNSNFFKVTCDIKNLSEINKSTIAKYKDELDFILSKPFLSIFHSLANKNKIFQYLDKHAHIWEELLFRAIPLLLGAVFSPILKVSIIAMLSFVVAQSIFIWLHKVIGSTKYKISNKHQLISIATSQYPYFSIIELENNEIISAEIYGEQISNTQLIENKLSELGLKLRYNNQNEIVSIKANGKTKVDIFDYEEPKNNIVNDSTFSKEELDVLYNATNTNSVVDIYFDEDINKTIETMYNAIQNKQLIVCHWFKNVYDINQLTDGQLLYLYNELNNKLSFIFDGLVAKFNIPSYEQYIRNNYKDMEYCEQFDYFFTETFKNILSHGFNGIIDSNNIVALYVETNSSNEIVKFKTFNKYNYTKTNFKADKFMNMTGITGLQVGSELMDNNPLKKRTIGVMNNMFYVNTVEQHFLQNISFDILRLNYKNTITKVARKLGIPYTSIAKSTLKLTLFYLPSIIINTLTIFSIGFVPSISIQLLLLATSTLLAIKWHKNYNETRLKDKLNIFNRKDKATNETFSDEELDKLYKYTNTSDFINICLEDSEEEILSKAKQAIDEKKLIVVDFLSYNSASKIFKLKKYTQVGNNIAKLRFSTLFPQIVEDERYYKNMTMHSNIDFFVREILKNAFVHGNQGNTKIPTALYIKTDENNEFKGFEVYNKIISTKRNKNLKLLKKIGLTGQHKGVSLMKHHPWFQYDAEQIDDDTFYKASVSVKDYTNLTDEEIRTFAIDRYYIATLSILNNLQLVDKKFSSIAQKVAPVWEELLFRTLPAILTVFNPAIGIVSYLISQTLFLFAHTITIWLTTKDRAKAFNITKQLIKPTLKLQLPYLPSLILATISPITALISIPLSTIIAMILHAKHNERINEDKLNIADITDRENITKFSQKELDIMLERTGASGYEDVYFSDYGLYFQLTQFVDRIKQLSMQNKIIILHFEREDVRTSEQDEYFLSVKYSMIRDFCNSGMLINQFEQSYEEMQKIHNSFSYVFPYSNNYPATLSFFFRETIHNALAHGNKGLLEVPIALYIKLENPELIDSFYVFNKNIQKPDNYEYYYNLMKEEKITGMHLGVSYMEGDYIIKYDANFINNETLYKVFCDVYHIKNFKIEKKNGLNYVVGLNPKQEKLDKKDTIGLLPENIQMVNDKLQQENSLLKIATSIALKEIEDSFKPNFVDKHTSEKGKQGANYVAKFIKRYMSIIDKLSDFSSLFALYLSDFIELIIGISVVKHIIVDYRYFKSNKLKDAIKTFGSNVSINDNYDIEIDNKIQVLIVDDLDQIKNDYKLVNTGIKIDGKSIYRIKATGVLIYGANGVHKDDIIKTLNSSSELKSEINKQYLKFGKNIDIQLDGFVLQDGDGINFENDITIIGNNNLLNKTAQYVNDYIHSVLEIKNTVSVMYSQKSIIDLTNITEFEKLKQAIYNGKIRKVISEEQFKLLSLTSDEILKLRQNGIELYIESQNNMYRKLGISGGIFDVKGKKYLIDYFMEEIIEVDEVDSNLTINELENKLVNSVKPVIIDLKILENKFRDEKDITNVFRCFDTLLGNIKMKVGLGEITNKNIESVGYNISFDLLPVLPENTDKLIFKQSNINEFINILSIQSNSVIGILLQSIKSESLKNKFIEILKERILAKSVLIQEDKQLGLQDKKLEILLGKMLLQQIGQKDITTIDIGENFIGTPEEIFNKINTELTKIDNNNKDKDISINTIIEIILVYGQDYKAKQMYTEQENNIMQYKAMLAAA